MFNDERERLLLDPQRHEQSIQTWAQQLKEEAKNRHSLRSHLLLMIGRTFIRIGSKLTTRFGAASESYRSLRTHDRVYS